VVSKLEGYDKYRLKNRNDEVEVGLQRLGNVILIVRFHVVVQGRWEFMDPPEKMPYAVTPE